MEKQKKQPNFYVREGEVRFVFFTNKPMIILMYNEVYFNTNDLRVMPSVVVLCCKSLKIYFMKISLTNYHA